MLGKEKQGGGVGGGGPRGVGQKDGISRNISFALGSVLVVYLPPLYPQPHYGPCNISLTNTPF